jgi:serine/threonine protein kinase
MAVKKFRVVSEISGVDQAKLKLIKNEIYQYRKLVHPNIVAYFGCEFLDQSFCIYLEEMKTSLANMVAEFGSFDEATVKSYSL